MASLPDQQDVASVPTGTDAKDDLPRRRLSPALWTVVGVLIGWTAIIVVGSPPPAMSPLLAGLPFLAVLAIACLGFLAVNRYFRERDLRRSVRAEIDRLHALNEWIAKPGVRTKSLP
jgi:heme A synthase